MSYDLSFYRQHGKTCPSETSAYIIPHSVTTHKALLFINFISLETHGVRNFRNIWKKN
jgi:hypothetical protein